MWYNSRMKRIFLVILCILLLLGCTPTDGRDTLSLPAATDAPSNGVESRMEKRPPGTSASTS